MIAFDIADEAARPRLYSSEREEWVDMPAVLAFSPSCGTMGHFSAKIFGGFRRLNSRAVPFRGALAP